jgi:hypothetical protein
MAGAQQMRSCIGVTGAAKRGTSTLINGLLGRPEDLVAPICKSPATSVVSYFVHGQREEARVLFHSDPPAANRPHPPPTAEQRAANSAGGH